MMRSGRADLAVCDSLENGVIVLYNQIRTKANSEFDILLDETDIDGILGGKAGIYAPEVSALVERMAQDFVNDLTNGLRERMLDLSSGRVVFICGRRSNAAAQADRELREGKERFVCGGCERQRKRV